MQSTAATASAATEEDFMPRARSSGAVLWIVVAEWLHQDELVFEWGRKTYEKGMGDMVVEVVDMNRFIWRDYTRLSMQ